MRAARRDPVSLSLYTLNSLLDANGRDRINMQPFCQPPVPGSFDYAVDVDHSPLLTEEEDGDHQRELAQFNWTSLIQRTFRTSVAGFVQKP